MHYDNLKQTKKLFIRYQNKVSPVEQSNLLLAIQSLTGALTLIFEKEGRRLKALNQLFKMTIIKVLKWNCSDFVENFVTKTREVAKTDQNPIIRYKIADALEIMRNLFDGDISFYKSNLSPFKGIHIEQTQMEQIRTVMQEITLTHIQEQIDRIEEELRHRERATNHKSSSSSQRFFKGESTTSSTPQSTDFVRATSDIDDGKVLI